ncbi:MAG: radical SAM protein [Verrucomicrobiales bacterium]
MINLTRLLCDVAQPADSLRYGLGHGAPRAAADRKPIVVWNITRRYNLLCAHCYSDSTARHYPGELTLPQFFSTLDDLAAFGVPGVLFSGGEPLIHPHFFDIAGYARQAGLRLTLSTNGTLIDKYRATRLQELGFAYVGISLDGIGETHDTFRGRPGAFDKAVAAFRHLRDVCQKSGLRLTLTRHTVSDLRRILDFIEAEDIRRVCFYHLVYSGRGAQLSLLEPRETRQALNQIIARVEIWHQSGQTREVLTVDQPADGAYLWMRQASRDPSSAARILNLLRWNGGGNHASGTGLANIDTQGAVHPDQFWQTHTLGNVKTEPFSRIWSRTDDALLNGLRSRTRPLEGRCSTCRFRDICGGGFRVRAWQRHGNPWAEDPGCHLGDDEIAAPAVAASRILGP